jgi:uridine phosphorylase
VSPPLLSNKDYEAPSVFLPAALLAHARRQRGLPAGDVPEICLLDPDGDIVKHLRRTNRSRPLPSWACYHTELDVFHLGGREVGIVGRAVGAAFAVLVAEELIASGCKLVVSITSAGRIAAGARVEFLLIERAVRDEGTSYHYTPAGREATLDPSIGEALLGAFDGLAPPVASGASWTTDAPFRETQQAIDRHAADGIACVEMEAAALYAFAQASGADVVCLAHLTNDMGTSAIDFEKGAAEGAEQALGLVARIAARLAPGAARHAGRQGPR